MAAITVEFHIENWRWSGVPFYVRAGKRLAKPLTEIRVHLKQTPHSLFARTRTEHVDPNVITIRIQPNEGISLQFEVKRRGPAVDLAAVKMDFRYDDWFEKEPNVGYETLISDVMMGDPTLFMRADMVEQAWRVVQPVLDAWAQEPAAYPNYDSGSDGPEAADALLTRDGVRAWRPVEPGPEEKT